MKRLAVLLCALFLVPAIGRAGSASSPEIADPAGDGISAATDLTAVWFTTTRDAHDAVTGFDVHFRTGAAPAADEETQLAVGWTLDAGQPGYCSGSASVNRTHPGDVIYIVPEAFVSFSCDGDDGTVSVGPLHVSVMNSNETAYVENGTDVVVSVPLSSFTTSPSKLLYRAGAKLMNESASSNLIAHLVPIPSDQTGCPIDTGTDPSCGARPFVIGS